MFDLRRSLSLRRGSPVLIDGAFERLFCPEGSSKVQMPGGLPGGGC